MTPLAEMSIALQSLTMRNNFHKKIMLGITGILGLSGLILLVYAFSVEGTERIVGLVGGALFEVMIILPYNKIQDLRKQNIMIGMVTCVIHRFQDKVAPETLNELVGELLQHSLRR